MSAPWEAVGFDVCAASLGWVSYVGLKLWARYRTTTEQAVNTSNSDPSHPALHSSTSVRTSLALLCSTAPQPPLAGGLRPTCWWYKYNCFHECCPERPPKALVVPSQASCNHLHGGASGHGIHPRDVWCWNHCRVLQLPSRFCCPFAGSHSEGSSSNEQAGYPRDLVISCWAFYHLSYHPDID